MRLTLKEQSESGVTKTAWDVLFGVANLCGMFCPGCQKMAWNVLSRDVLSGSLGVYLANFPSLKGSRAPFQNCKKSLPLQKVWT